MRHPAVAHINRIATAVPDNEVHQTFLAFAETQLGRRDAALFRRMAQRSGIERRYSCLGAAGDPDVVQAEALYRPGHFPGTAARMALYRQFAPQLAETAVARLKLGRARITHLIVASCTGFSAPGVDLELIERCGLDPSVERTMVGFMGCYAAINALKLAHHIVRSQPDAQVLAINLELCTLHLKDKADIQQTLSFLLFADGCSAALVSAEPTGLALDSFAAVLVPESRDMITWAIDDSGFEMFLSGQVPATIESALRGCARDVLRGTPASAIELWGVHPGGRTVLDAVEHAFALEPSQLSASREVLRRYGNMSSATVMFVLEALMRHARPGARGCAMSFGPGVVAETMLFHAAEPARAESAARGVLEPAAL
jgi:predicted naringenin-chalcone synthase